MSLESWARVVVDGHHLMPWRWEVYVQRARQFAAAPNRVDLDDERFGFFVYLIAGALADAALPDPSVLYSIRMLENEAVPSPRHVATYVAGNLNHGDAFSASAEVVESLAANRPGPVAQLFWIHFFNEPGTRTPLLTEDLAGPELHQQMVRTLGRELMSGNHDLAYAAIGGLSYLAGYEKERLIGAFVDAQPGTPMATRARAALREKLLA